MRQLSPSERHFDLAKWLDLNATVQLKSGDEWILDCPACGREHKLAVNVRKKAWQCFLCTFAGWRPGDLIARFAGIGRPEADRIVENAACHTRNHIEPLHSEKRKPLHRLLPVAAPPPGVQWFLDEQTAAYASHRGIASKNRDDFLLGSIVGDGSGSKADRMLRGRLLIPVWDLQGRFVYWVARDTTGRSKAKVLNYPASDKHVDWGLPYVADSATRNEVLVGLHLAQKNQPIYLVEGPLDAVVCGAGFVASMGAKLSLEQAYLIAARSPSSVTVLYDGDEAGQKGAEQAHSLLSAFVPTRIAHLPPGSDPAELGRKACLELSSNSTGMMGVSGLSLPKN